MTTKQLLIVDVADIQALRLECLKCGAAVSFKPLAPFEATGPCATCGQPAYKQDEPRKGDSRPLVKQFVEAVRNLQVPAPGQQPTYRVYFEMEPPPG
jgi:hypothetical protein